MTLPNENPDNSDSDSAAPSKPEKPGRFSRLFNRNKAAEKTQNKDTEALPLGCSATQSEINHQIAAIEPENQHSEAHSGREKKLENEAKGSPETLVGGATLEAGLAPTRSGLIAKIAHVFKSSFDLNDELFDDLEDLLISSDVGIEASLKLVDRLRDRITREKTQTEAGVLTALKVEITEMLKPAQRQWNIDKLPYVVLMVGVNGVGKTTTTAKIAMHFQQQGKTVMLAAADTFRAAAVEQLQVWGQRLGIQVVAQGQGADAAAVAHDALTAAQSRAVDVLIIDTAGRLHTQTDLMRQLQKVSRVLAKLDAATPHEVIQVLDAGTGQNALSQLEHFQKAVGVNSLCLTKLDGSAKGGVALALTEKYQLPIRFIGIGEGFDDLKVFDAVQFANALIPD